MIQYDPKSLLGVLFRVRGSIAARLLPRTLAAAAVGLAAVFLLRHWPFKLPPLAHTLIGVALGLLLVFRTNASYDRYWEGRKLLGSMVNRTRDIARQLRTYVTAPDDVREAAFAEVERGLRLFYALTVMSLRSETDLGTVDILRPDERAELEPLKARAPMALVWVSRRIEALAKAGHLRDVHVQVIDASVTALMDSLGGCERIARTPVPFAYAQHIKWFVTRFCCTGPVVMVDSRSWGTPVAAAILAFALYGIDEIGVEIEDPFGDDPNDLPMEAVGETIGRSVQDLLATKAQ